MTLDSRARMAGGTLTFTSNDGYVVEAPVEWFETHVDNDYKDVAISDLLDSACIFRTDYTVDFTARLKYGENYTIRDIGVDTTKTLTVRGDCVHDKKRRTALGVPADAPARYSSKKDETKFYWKERVIVDSEGGT